ncbi:hypothetical protein ABFY62_31020 [Pseudomonas aeruginosa]|uniref:hypothetical protein n=1 Tax=Pseudomonas aeruginosa TaxID=287 RepID=UPI003D28E3BB
MRIMLLVFCSMGGLEYDYNESLSWCAYIDAKHNREVVDMAISFEPLDVEGVDFRGVDVVAYKARKGRGRSGDIGLENALAQ